MKFIEDDFLNGQRLDPATDGRPDLRPTSARTRRSSATWPRTSTSRSRRVRRCCCRSTPRATCSPRLRSRARRRRSAPAARDRGDLSVPRDDPARAAPGAPLRQDAAAGGARARPDARGRAPRGAARAPRPDRPAVAVACSTSRSPSRSNDGGSLRHGRGNAPKIDDRYAAARNCPTATSAIDEAVIATSRARSASLIESGGISTTTSPSGRMIAPRRRAASVTW